MAFTSPVYHGPHPEWTALLHAVSRNCACDPPCGGGRPTNCAAHGMLDNQQQLDRLAFLYTMRGKLGAEEWERREPA